MKPMNGVALRLGLLTALALLAVGFGLAQFWPGELVLLAMVLAGWLGRRTGWKRLPHALLVLFVSAAACGVLVGASAYLMIAGVAFALVSWDLAGQQPIHSIEATRPLEDVYEREHLKWLGAATGLGLLVAEAGLFLAFSIPFWGNVLITLLVSFCIYRFYCLVKKTSTE